MRVGERMTQLEENEGRQRESGGRYQMADAQASGVCVYLHLTCYDSSPGGKGEGGSS